MEKPNKTRISRACESCRSRKIRCDGEAPCAACKTANLPCRLRQTDLRGRKRKSTTLDSAGGSPRVDRQNGDAQQYSDRAILHAPHHSNGRAGSISRPGFNGGGYSNRSISSDSAEDGTLRPTELILQDPIRGDDRVLPAASFRAGLVSIVRPCGYILGNDLFEQTCRLSVAHFASTDSAALSSIFTLEQPPVPHPVALDIEACYAIFRARFLPVMPVLDEEDLANLRPACEAVIHGMPIDDVATSCTALCMLALASHMLEGTLPGDRESLGWHLFARARSNLTPLMGSSSGMPMFQAGILAAIYLDRSNSITAAWMLMGIVARSLQMSGYNRAETASALPLGVHPHLVAKRRNLFWCAFNHEECMSWYVGLPLSNGPQSFDQVLPSLPRSMAEPTAIFSIVTHLSHISSKAAFQLYAPRTGATQESTSALMNEAQALINTVPDCLANLAIASKFHHLMLVIARSGLVTARADTAPVLRWRCLDRPWRRELYHKAKHHAHAMIANSPICRPQPDWSLEIATGLDFHMLEHALVFILIAIIVDVCDPPEEGLARARAEFATLAGALRPSTAIPIIRNSPMHNIGFQFLARCTEISEIALSHR